MMNYVTIMLFSIAVTFDGLIIGLSYGSRKVKISFINNIIVGAISCLGTMAGMYLGQLFNGIFVESIAGYIGNGLLLGFGIYMLYQAIKKHLASIKANNNMITDAADLAETFDKDHSKSIELSEAFILGLFLCINNFGLGVGAALTGLNVLVTSATCFVLSVIFIEIGHRLTYNLLSDKTVQYSEYIASVIIILLAIFELFF